MFDVPEGAKIISGAVAEKSDDRWFLERNCGESRKNAFFRREGTTPWQR